ncbi:MAG: chemotaxis protein CheW [Burkholderiaceae bacterium]
MNANKEKLQDFQQRLQARLNEDKTDQSNSKLGVVIGDAHWLIDLAEAGEILPIPDSVSPIPGTKPWFYGLTNLRGSLFGVTDLVMFEGQAAPQYGKDARLVAFSDKLEVNAAILVNKMMGLQNMTAMQMDPDSDDSGWKGRCYLDDAGIEWRELHLSRLCHEQNFLTITH